METTQERLVEALERVALVMRCLDRELLTPKEYAAWTGAKESTVRDKMRTRALATYKDPETGRVYIHRDQERPVLERLVRRGSLRDMEDAANAIALRGDKARQNRRAKQ